MAKGMEVEQRRQRVAQGLLAHKTLRQIHAELEGDTERPARCSLATVGRDALAVRQEWAAARTGSVNELVAEELARLRELEKAWWDKARAGEGDATERVLAIMRQRSALLGLGASKTAVQVTAGAMAGVAVSDEAGRRAALASASAVKVRVEYVDDWRTVRE